MMIKKIAIVGGGTAGWLAANHLGQSLQGSNIEITLIESPTIPTIGVGEGTVPSMRNSLQKFGISESDFINECDVTFKQSIKFVNWLDKTKHGSNFYHHLFDHPHIFGEQLTDAWLVSNESSDYASFVSKQHLCCEKNLAPKTITTPEFMGVNGYAYHFDAKKFAAFLSRHAEQSFSVKHHFADIKDVVVDDAGYITHLVDEHDVAMAFDFVIDCTGFSAAILGNKLGVEFLDKSDCLLTDTAITLQVPTSPDDEIPPYTIATAHQAGWIWDIALTQRRGVGFVYSSKYMTEQQALDKLHKYLGEKFNHLTPRKIPMKVGRREKMWHKNCVAIGLSQGFVEPLEATAILIADFSANLLAKRFPRCKADIALVIDDYNRHVNYVWEQTFDFIKMHYCISDRTDSEFWIDNRKDEQLSPQLKNNLARWQRFAPNREDFASKFDLFDLENYLYVLFGMRYLPASDTLNTVRGFEQLTSLKQQRVNQLLGELPTHRALLEKIKKFGMQKQ
ncbi:tryptophan halogenase family protein [Pseudoalteromonas sp. L21]|uniref:tryptophan halogenase family protein n=1 Tax=Pseudoalteromonas sp. L21 TaxID=1539746 RepID=UPI001F2DD77A|nr:tryptophan 7-halogenase [Pseudoalteromonas sp. L21]